jgi:putative flippase GtrA
MALAPKFYLQVLRYLIAGSIATAVQFSVLYLLTDIVKIWYLWASISAFIFTYITSFTLQKFWTFRDKRTEVIGSQAALSLGVALVNLGLNAWGMYLLVDGMGFWYIYAQIIVTGIIAFESFVMYKFIIFRKKDTAYN